MFQPGDWIAQKRTKLRVVHRVLECEGNRLRTERFPVIGVLIEGAPRMLIVGSGTVCELSAAYDYQACTDKLEANKCAISTGTVDDL